MADEAPDVGKISTHREEHLLLITIERTSKLNAFSPEMLNGLSEAYTQFEDDPALRCAVLLAAGPHFTAGLDLNRLSSTMAAGGPLFPIGKIDPTDLRPPRRSKPVVCAVQGICFTLGIELMLAADVVIASSDCRFAQLEVKRGIFASQGGCFRIVERAGWGNAQRYLLTGDEFDATEAYRLGLVQEVVQPGDQVNRAVELANRIAAQAPLAVQASLASSRKYAELGMAAAAAELDAVQQDLFATEDAQEGIRSFRERRTGQYQGR